MLPLILQHVRELAEAHAGGIERDRYKLITPFPPEGSDFPDFSKDALAFNDPPREGSEASQDTVRAYEFSKRTDAVYYDYSYGIRSDDYLLSTICDRFFWNASPDDTDPAFSNAFAEKSEAYLHKYLRSTVGELGRNDFRYCSLSPLSWTAITLDEAESARLQDRAIAVYADLEQTGVVQALLEGLRSTRYAAVQYEFGYFDVIREWLDPHLFDGPWQFKTGGRTLYGESDPFFAANADVQLCFAQRYYLVKNDAATLAAPAATPDVRDHREMPLDGAGADLRRRAIRNTLITRRLATLAMHAPPATTATVVTRTELAPPPRAGFVWVPAAGGVAGHWERARAGVPQDPKPTRDDTSYKVAAIKCRVLPRNP